LELQSVVAASGWSFQRTAKGRIPRLAWVLQLVLFGGWLFLFWTLGAVVPVDGSEEVASGYFGTTTVTRACLERIGVIGIALTALLSGFAAISSPWHAFGPPSRRRPVTDNDLSRKQAGLDATCEMLTTKRHRLQILERKTVESTQAAQSAGFMGRVLGTFRGLSSDESEIRSLRLEISGLETMQFNLSSTLTLLRARHAEKARAATPLGKILSVPNHLFSLYCIYRVLATLLTTLRRLSSPTASFSSSDPINRLLGLLARHWDPKLDQLAWARTISFLLSGAMLALSATSALQTFHLFARFAPSLLLHARANLPLLLGQIASVYVISAALLLRSNLPREAGTAVGDALRSALEPGFVDRWFEGWFLVASAATAAGVWVGSKLGGSEWEEWDDYGGEEMGQKRS
jgi:hypothetical protein